MKAFTTNFYIATLFVLGFIFVDRLPYLLGGHVYRISEAVAMLHSTQLTSEDFQTLTAGYYEGFRDDKGGIDGIIEKDDIRGTPFLGHELRPNLNHSYKAGMRVTNSLGMANPEVGYEKPPGTRRIALLGDSMSLGPYGEDYVWKLEESLTRDYKTPTINRYQFLNFAVYGYSVVQVMDVALEKVPKFHPDVYMLALTQLDVNEKADAANHLARLFLNGEDLKYEYLRQVAARSGARPADGMAGLRLKFAPFLTPVTQWAVEQMKRSAAAQGAPLVIVLLPAPIDFGIVRKDFARLHQLVDTAGVPVVDLRDTFQGVNLDDVRVDSMRDVHPNARGHQLIFENLYRKLRAAPGAWADLTGNGAAEALVRTPVQ